MDAMIKSHLRLLLPIVAILLVLFPKPADAYLDPGAGSMLWQVLLAFVLALGYVARRYWAKIRGLFGKRNTEDDANQDDDHGS